jgi:hypothetical protein
MSRSSPSMSPSPAPAATNGGELATVCTAATRPGSSVSESTAAGVHLAQALLLLQEESTHSVSAVTLLMISYANPEESSKELMLSFILRKFR